MEYDAGDRPLSGPGAQVVVWRGHSECASVLLVLRKDLQRFASSLVIEPLVCSRLIFFWYLVLSRGTALPHC